MDHNTFVAVFGTPGRGGGFCDEYQAVYNAMTNQPSSSVAEAQNTMVKALVDTGIWDKLDLFYLFAQESNDDSEAYINLVNPGTYDITPNIASAFTSLEGVASGGATWYMDTGYNPTSHGVNLSQNSASLGIYCRTNVSDTTFELGTVEGSVAFVIGARYSGNTYLKINDGTAFSVANADSRGLYIGSRTGATTRELYKNGTSIADDSQASNGLSNNNLYVGRYNGAAAPSSRQLSMAFFGGGLTDTDVTNMTNAVETYMDSNSKGVIA